MLPITPDVWWPNLEAPLEVRDFSYDATADITFSGVVDPIVSVTFSANPSGSGEVVPTLVSQYANVVTAWLSGGVPGRVYKHQMVLTTASGRVIPVYIGQVCDPLLATFPVAPAPVAAFGTPIMWAGTSMFDFSTPIDSSYSILL